MSLHLVTGGGIRRETRRASSRIWPIPRGGRRAGRLEICAVLELAGWLDIYLGCYGGYSGRDERCGEDVENLTVWGQPVFFGDKVDC